ncbi:hypothetical protein [Natrinema sp. SYSU A 869]|uniref:hypothetical protein n=1 Tax=Natrinema sp. SYSU A 869 TaxID=2871694 RepID=UPI001CA4694D|nr:hypothetical protein [Natrinema sp. SYSU A 869]
MALATMRPRSGLCDVPEAEPDEHAAEHLDEIEQQRSVISSNTQLSYWSIVPDHYGCWTDNSSRLPPV